MASKIGQLKPFMLEEKKEGPNKTVSETTANKWQGCIIANIKKEEKWLPFLSPKTWGQKKATNRDITGGEAAATAPPDRHDAGVHLPVRPQRPLQRHYPPSHEFSRCLDPCQELGRTKNLRM